MENPLESPLGDGDQVLRDGICVVPETSAEFEFDHLRTMYTISIICMQVKLVLALG